MTPDPEDSSVARQVTSPTGAGALGADATISCLTGVVADPQADESSDEEGPPQLQTAREHSPVQTPAMLVATAGATGDAQSKHGGAEAEAARLRREVARLQARPCTTLPILLPRHAEYVPPPHRRSCGRSEPPSSVPSTRALSALSATRWCRSARRQTL